MILVVAGPITNKFETLIAKIVAIGTRVVKRFSLARRPPKPDGIDPDID